MAAGRGHRDVWTRLESLRASDLLLAIVCILVTITVVAVAVTLVIVIVIGGG